jgi:hypothetical protein
MRTLVVISLTVLMLVCGASASASGWRDLRIDASSVSTFDDSVQEMRDQLPYPHALLFVLVLHDLKMRFSPTEYRQQLEGLSYEQIAHLASPNVMAEYLGYYALRRVGQPVATPSVAANSAGGAVAPEFYSRP